MQPSPSFRSSAVCSNASGAHVWEVAEKLILNPEQRTRSARASQLLEASTSDEGVEKLTERELEIERKNRRKKGSSHLQPPYT